MGYVKYTSHLDLLRIFKRAFKKTRLGLKYSQGFNPHPKMGFAQPLSLGYSGKCELIEFELNAPMDEKLILQRMQSEMPDGISLLECILQDLLRKSVHLDIHLDSSYTLRSSCNLEVHVSQEVFHSLDIRKDSHLAASILFYSLDKTHSDACYRSLDRNTCIHQCQTAAAY